MKGYKPVSIVAREGPQGTIPVKCDLNTVLLFASLSRLGVIAFMCFMKPKQSHLHWSAHINKTDLFDFFIKV